MSLNVFTEQKHLQKTTPFFNAELVNKYSKYVKSIGKRVVEVEFCWFQAQPCQSFRLRMTEKQFLEAKKQLRSKKILAMNFEQFTDLIAPVIANDAAEINDFVLRSTFDRLFDQNSNGTIEKEEFQSLINLLKALNNNQSASTSTGNLRRLFIHRNGHITFKEFCDFVKQGHVRQLLMG